MNILAWIGLAIAIASPLVLVAVLGGRSQNSERAKLLASGALGEAEILGYERGEFHLVSYQFMPSGEATPIKCKKIIAHTEEQYVVGSKVPVRYKAEHPSVSLLVPYATSQVPTS